MQFLTDFADQGVTLPLAAVAGLVLLLAGWRRGALAWAAAGALCWGTMFVLKVSFDVCGPDPGPGVLADPSGHAASGTFVYAGLVALAAGPRFAGPAAVAVAAAVGASRVQLGVHSLPDVLVGGAVGIASVLMLATLAGPRPRTSASRRGMAILAVAPVLLHGSHLEAEARIRAAAGEWAIWPLSLCLPDGFDAAAPPSHDRPATGSDRNPRPAPALAHFQSEDS